MSAAADVTPYLPFHPSPAQYERAALRLARSGAAFAGIMLKPLDYGVLVWIAGQRPGILHHQGTIGTHFGMGKDAMHDVMNRLRNRPNRKTGLSDGYGVPLIFSEEVRIKSRLAPLTGGEGRTQTKTNRYWLSPALLELLDREESAQAQIAANKRALRVAEAPPEALPPPAAQLRPGAGPDLSWAEPGIQAIGAAFDALGLFTRRGERRRPLGTDEHTALRNRLVDSCTVDDLRAAVYGAEHWVWEKRDGSFWAADPFAVVFATADSVRKFARRGREQMARDVAEGNGAALAAAAQEAPAAEPPPVSTAGEPSLVTAGQPSSTGSWRSLDQEPNYKTTTAGEPEPSSACASAPPTNGASETPPSADLTRPSAPASLPRPPAFREREAGQGDKQNRGQRPPAVTPSAQAPASAPPAAQSRLVMLAGRQVTVTTSPTQVLRDQERSQMDVDREQLRLGITPEFLRPRGPNGERVAPRPNPPAGRRR